MQAVCVQKPFAAAGVSAIRSSSTRAVGVVRAAAAQPEAAAELRLPRRALAGLLAAVPVLLPASRALALIPDDDDEDLIERARANRKNKLASERQTEKAFSRSAKGLDRVLELELIPVQRAINSLAQGGSQLESGDIKAAAATLSGAWLRDFQAATEKLSYSDAAKTSAASMLSSLNALEASAARGSTGDAKKSFVAAVGAFKGWAAAAGVANDLKGL